MKKIAWIIPAAAMTAAAGCVMVDGKTETRTYTHAGFDSIAASSGIDVVVSQGPFAVKAEAPEGRLDRIIIEQDGSELRLSRKDEITWFGWGGRYVVTVVAPSVVSISASGGADVDASGLEGQSLSLSASGGGDIDLRGLKVATLNASASGGGDIDASGTCQTASISTSGGGDFNGEHLDCTTVTAEASGGGDIDIGASASANGTASSGGDIRFRGSPATFTKDESSGGDVSVEGR